jgi:hypothetical protein
MSGKTNTMFRSLFARCAIGLLGTAAMLAPIATSANATSGAPEIIRGIPGAPASEILRLVYQASFPNGSLDSSVDKLNVGPMQPGDPLIPDTNPTIEPRPGAMLVRVSRPIGLSPELIPAESLWATPVEFGPGSIARFRATFIAPDGPYATTGGFAIGVVARTGGKDDLPTETLVAVTVNARPNQQVRLQIPFGATAPTNVVLPQAVRDAIYSTTDPQPFTIELTVDRVNGTGTAKLMVIDQVFTLNFTLSTFLADGGPTITAAGPGIAVNSNAPGQTASVQIRDFRIYANVGD